MGGNTFNKGGVSVWTDEMNRTMQRKRRARSDEAETNARSVPFRINQAAQTLLALKKKREAEAKAKATDEAARIVEGAQAEIDQEINRAREELRAKVGELAVEGAERILEASVDRAAHEAMLSKLSAQL